MVMMMMMMIMMKTIRLIILIFLFSCIILFSQMPNGLNCYF
jgi:hypothetical protein